MQITFAAIAAYIVLLPTVAITQDLPWHDEQRLAQIVLLLIIAANMAFGIASSRRVEGGAMWNAIPRRIVVALAAAFIFGAISAAVAPQQRWAFVEWAMFVLLIALGMNIYRIRRDYGGACDRLLLGMLVFVSIAYLLKVFAGYTGALVSRLPVHIWWLLDGFSNPRAFGHFQTMTLPLLVLPAMFWGKTRLSRLGLAMLPTMWWMLSIASGTRGTWLAMMVACFVVFLCVGRRAYRWLKWQSGAFFAGLAAYGVIFFALPSLLSVSVDTVNRVADIANLSFRDIIWKLALEHVVAHPILGIGPMHFAYYPNSVAAHPHMSLLQWASEWGLPSALILFGVIFYGGLTYVRQLRSLPGNTFDFELRLALLAALTAAAAQSLVDGIIVMPYSQTLLAVLCGWAFAIQRTDGSGSHSASFRMELAGVAIVLLSAVLLATGVFPEVRALVHRQSAFDTRKIHTSPPLPRFWSQGWIRQ